ncbi:hypothetical protein O9992_18265 [Vibrio lentus]|nr:hypothetical protein [Vibrio lentus]
MSIELGYTDSRRSRTIIKVEAFRQRLCLLLLMLATPSTIQLRPFVTAGLSYVDLNSSNGAFYGDDSGAGFHFGVGVEYTSVENR